MGSRSPALLMTKGVATEANDMSTEGTALAEERHECDAIGTYVVGSTSSD